MSCRLARGKPFMVCILEADVRPMIMKLYVDPDLVCAADRKRSGGEYK